MKITVNTSTSVARGQFGANGVRLMKELEGRKKWIDYATLSFETSAHNLSVMTKTFPGSDVIDKRASIEAIEAMDLGERRPLRKDVGPFFKMAPLDFQLENFERFKDKPVFAIFSEQGTGKTKVALDIISHRALTGMVTGVLILSSPKGVHAQWIDEQLPKHLWDCVPHKAYVWDGGKSLPAWIGKSTPGELQIISGNIDMLKAKGLGLLEVFAHHHKGRLLILVDESDSIKNKMSARHARLCELAANTSQRAIMSGSPIAKDLTDEWAQFFFLDQSIIGHKYLTSFRSQFCVLGGHMNREVIGHRNLDAFKALTAPHIFRATKSKLHLPPKVFDTVVFDMSVEQRRMIRELRDRFYADVEGVDDKIAVKTGAVALIRIQQISNGFAIDEVGTMHHLKSNPRLDAVIDLRARIAGKVVIWARFQEDVRLLQKAFPASAQIFGGVKQSEREYAKRSFINDPKCREIIATAAAAGKGVDGLQVACSDAIYYSNTYNSIDRWQSEDRIHRLGMGETATYFDLIARGSIDRGILRNLQEKKDIATMILDDPINIDNVAVDNAANQLDAIKTLMDLIS